MFLVSAAAYKQIITAATRHLPFSDQSALVRHEAAHKHRAKPHATLVALADFNVTSPRHPGVVGFVKAWAAPGSTALRAYAKPSG